MNKIKTIISGLAHKLTLSNVFYCLVATSFAHSLLVRPALNLWTGKDSVQVTLFVYVGIFVFFTLLVVAVSLISALARRFKVFRLTPSAKRVLKGIKKAAFIAICIVFIPLFFLIDILSLGLLLGFQYGIFGFITVPLWLALSWYIFKFLRKDFSFRC